VAFRAFQEVAFLFLAFLEVAFLFPTVGSFLGEAFLVRLASLFLGMALVPIVILELLVA